MTSFTKIILKKIHIKRQSLGYSQEYMGCKLGICQEAYGKIERGQTELTTDRLSNIADIFEVNILTLII